MLRILHCQIKLRKRRSSRRSPSGDGRLSSVRQRPRAHTRRRVPEPQNWSAHLPRFEPSEDSIAIPRRYSQAPFATLCCVFALFYIGKAGRPFSRPLETVWLRISRRTRRDRCGRNQDLPDIWDALEPASQKWGSRMQRSPLGSSRNPNSRKCRGHCRRR